MISIAKFLHLLCGTTFLGIIIATFFYIAYSFKRHDQPLMTYSLKASYFGDAVILLCIVIQSITAAMLVSVGHLSLTIPWIRVAHIAFGCVILLWLACVFIKFVYLSKTEIKPLALQSFYLCNIAIIVIYIIIIHDAITQSTWFDFL